MERIRFTDERAERLLEAYRRRPGVAQAAARAVGCDRRTATKAWNEGFTHRSVSPKYQRPFKDIIEDEQAEARARLQREAVEAHELAVKNEAHRRGVSQEDAIQHLTEERTQEAHLVRNARAATIVLLNTVAQISGGLNKLGGKVKGALEEASKGEIGMREAQSALTLMTKLTTSLRQCNDAGQRAMEMSRLLLGEPQKIIGHAHLEGVTVDEAKERVAAAARAVKALEGMSDEVGEGSSEMH